MWPSSTCTWAIVRTSSQILVCSTRATVSSTQTIVFLSSDLVRFLYKPLSSNSSDPRQIFLRKNVRPLLPSPALLKKHIRAAIASSYLEASPALCLCHHRLFGGAIVIDLWVIAMIGSRPVVSFLSSDLHSLSSVIYTCRKLSLRVSSFCNHRIV